MSVPTRAQAAAVLNGLIQKQKLINHLSAAAEVCAFMCAALAKNGVEVNSDLAEGATLLHDIDKGFPLDDPYRALGHGAGGAQWLTDHGHGELAPAVRDHLVTVIAAASSYEEWAATQSLEAQLVAFADKRALQDIVSLGERFERWFKRYPDSPTEPIAYERYQELERDLCAMAGVAPNKVKRLPWVDAALAAAREA
ncbi:MAG: HD domain-containing protein [Chloroflexota bacterium]